VLCKALYGVQMASGVTLIAGPGLEGFALFVELRAADRVCGDRYVIVAVLADDEDSLSLPGRRARSVLRTRDEQNRSTLGAAVVGERATAQKNRASRTGRRRGTGQRADPVVRPPGGRCRRAGNDLTAGDARRAGRSGRPGGTGRALRSGRTRRTTRTARAGRTRRPRGTARAGRTRRPGRTRRTTRATRAGRTRRTCRTRRASRTSRTLRAGRTRRTTRTTRTARA
jgi:hypothetical protein